MPEPPDGPWDALAGMSSPAAVLADWERLLGQGLPLVAPFLTTTNRLASVYPCSSPDDGGCYRTVLTHSRDDVVGVCHSEYGTCDKVRLSKSDLAVRVLDEHKIAAHLQAMLRLSGTISEARSGSGPPVLHLGTHVPVAGVRFNAHLLVRYTPDEARLIFFRLAESENAPFILITSTSAWVTADAAERVRNSGSVLLSLAEIISVSPQGEPVMARPPADLLAPMLEGTRPQGEVNGSNAFFPTPAGATWDEVKIRFQDGHRVHVRVGEVQGTYNFTQMGMCSRKNGEPTKQWHLLEQFADGRGCVSVSGARGAQQKQRESLAKALQRFFRIDGDPIVAARRGWRTRFEVRPG